MTTSGISHRWPKCLIAGWQVWVKERANRTFAHSEIQAARPQILVLYPWRGGTGSLRAIAFAAAAFETIPGRQPSRMVTS